MSEANHGETTERRSSPRVRPAIDLLGYEGSDGVAHRELTDISRGGLRLVTTAPEQPGARVTLRLGFGEDGEADRQQIDVGGQVIWARQVAPFQSGIRFVSLSEAARKLLSQIAPAAPKRSGRR